MKKEIENLWYNYISCSSEFTQDSTVPPHLRAELVQTAEKLRGGLSEDMVKLMDKYEVLVSQVSTIEKCDAFKYGFSLAIRLITESGAR